MLIFGLINLFHFYVSQAQFIRLILKLIRLYKLITIIISLYHPKAQTFNISQKIGLRNIGRNEVKFISPKIILNKHL